MRDRFLVLFVLLGMACHGNAWPTRIVGRTLCPIALAPVDLRIERTGDASPGAAFRVTVEATAHVDCADTMLEIVLPAGASVVGGAVRWTGAMTGGETRSIAVDVTVPDGALRRFEGAVEVRSGSAVLPRTAVLEVGTAPRALSAPQAPIGEAADGVRIMVLPAREVSP